MQIVIPSPSAWWFGRGGLGEVVWERWFGRGGLGEVVWERWLGRGGLGEVVGERWFGRGGWNCPLVGQFCEAK